MDDKEFAYKAKNIAENFRTSYVWGSFGMTANASNMNRMISQYSKNKKYLTKAQSIYGKGFFFDCVGLIKAILWGWYGDSSKTYGGAKYTSNNVPDISADQMIKKCLDVSSDFKTIEVGEVVWLKGHIGIYIGDGIVVESTPAWKSGVQKSALANIGGISGLNSRKWTKHGKLPYVQYVTEINTSQPISSPTIEDFSPEPFVADNIPDSWAEEAVWSAINNKILFGDTMGDLKLHKNCTRQEMLVFLYRFYKSIKN